MRLGLGFGATRIAILIGERAIKIPRFGISRMMRHAFKIFLPQHAGWRKHRFAKYRKRETLFGAIRKYLITTVIGGIQANRQEFAISREHPELPLAQVLGMYLGGLVLVMERGEPVPPRVSRQLRKQFHIRCACDMRLSHHICLFGDVLKFIDYGHPNARRFLRIA